jgi:FkbM family methyltransferase
VLDLSAINRHSLPGRVLRAPLRLIPGDLVVPVVQGPLRGAWWVVGSSTHGCWLGCYEAESQAACVRRVAPGMVAFDLGANVGFYTLLLSRLVGPRGRVYAFEPSPQALGYLRRHVSMNAPGNVVVCEAAVGAVSGEATFVEGESLSTGRTVDDIPAPGRVVPQVALDDFVYAVGNPAPDFIKMDIEGGEAAALAGMRRVLSERGRRPALNTRSRAGGAELPSPGRGWVSDLRT